MRSFETYLVVGCVVAIVWPALFGVRARRGVVAVGLLVLIGLQLQIEGFRWQLTLLYLVALGLAIGDVITLERDIPWYRRIGRGLFGLMGLALAVSPALLLPVPKLPVPRGPLPMGTVTVEVVHPQRREQYGESPRGLRRFPAQVWYPAEAPAAGSPAPWVANVEAVAPAMADRAGLPGFFFDHVRHTDSHAWESAPPQPGPFPLLVYSHGWAEFRTIALDQIESLVSQGYVVVAPDHTHAAVATVVDGETIRYDPTALDDPAATPDQRVEDQALLIDTLAADVIAVLDELAAGPEGAFGELAASVELGSVGLWGHGLGGGGVTQVCLTDDRCDAVAGFDPWVESIPDSVLAVTATRPMLFMRSDPWRNTTNDAVLRGIVDRSRARAYWIEVRGADTSDFVAAPLLSPVADRLGLKGPIEGPRVIRITHRYLTGFFDRYLLGTGSAALDTATFQEVDVEFIDNRSKR